MGAIDHYPPFAGPSEIPPSPLVPAHFLPLRAHPGNLAPAPPPHEPLAPLPAGWVRSFHAAPAAYPRQLREAHGKLNRDSHPFGDPAVDKDKEARNERLARELRSCVMQRYDAHEWSIEEAEIEEAEAEKPKPPGLFLGLERWRRSVPCGGATIVCTHANGMQKEHWHPVIRDLLGKTAPAEQYGTGTPLEDVSIRIDDVWFLDDATHGLSMDLNAGLIGPCETWDDTGRDILNFVQHVLPSIKAAEEHGNDAPWQLWWGDAAPPVKVIGFGSSFGGVGHIAAAATRPDLFDGLFLVDPLIRPDERSLEKSLTPGTHHHSRVLGALKRRDWWESRVAARASLLSLPFYQRWDPEIVALTVSHGLVDEPSGGVTLATPRWAEASVFCEPIASTRCWDRLPAVTVPTAFFMAGTAMVGKAVTNEYVWRPPLARNERLPGSQHLVLQESPAGVAAGARRFLQTLAAGAWGTSPEDIAASYAATQIETQDPARAKL